MELVPGCLPPWSSPSDSLNKNLYLNKKSLFLSLNLPDPNTWQLCYKPEVRSNENAKTNRALVKPSPDHKWKCRLAPSSTSHAPARPPAGLPWLRLGCFPNFYNPPPQLQLQARGFPNLDSFQLISPSDVIHSLLLKAVFQVFKHLLGFPCLDAGRLQENEADGTVHSLSTPAPPSVSSVMGVWNPYLHHIHASRLEPGSSSCPDLRVVTGAEHHMTTYRERTAPPPPPSTSPLFSPIHPTPGGSTQQFADFGVLCFSERHMVRIRMYVSPWVSCLWIRSTSDRLQQLSQPLCQH